MFVKELNLEVRLYANKQTKEDLVFLLLGFGWALGFSLLFYLVWGFYSL